ncbi:hypothetical protein JCGZ_08397 [Jatropha curcas]|uniref:Uncharacterized protein n=1 Tax=Jatropha curcas TaxID=180498 RepID=A0A067KIQ5_JATCU|nr:hypothetical protein JCGZ_08397 [Jatropha curcas]
MNSGSLEQLCHTANSCITQLFLDDAAVPDEQLRDAAVLAQARSRLVDLKALVGLHQRSKHRQSSGHVQGSSPKFDLIGFEVTSEARFDWLRGFC